MRPVNLIPAEERRGERQKARTGPLVYVVVGVLGAILIGLALVVTTSNSISDSKAKKKDLEAQKESLQAQSQALRNYASFASLKAQREQTVVSLAHSRFDWERVMRELTLVLPEDVWLTQVTGTVSPNVTVTDSAGDTLRGSIQGPALALIGCGRSQDSVARLVAALHEIDGVTRVAVSKSEKPTDTATDASSGGSGSGGAAAGQGDDCRTRSTIPRFEIVMAFDEAPVAATAASGTTPGAPAPTTPPPGGTTTQPASSNGTSDAQQQQQSAAQATNDATQKAENAAQIVPGK